jgi:hypothetical protein
MLNRQKRLNTANYKNKRRKAKKICRKRAQELKMLEGTEEANKRNEAKNVLYDSSWNEGQFPAKNVHLYRQG